MKLPSGACSLVASSGGTFWPKSRTNSSSTVNTVTRLHGKKAGVSVPRLSTYSRPPFPLAMATG